MAHPSVFPTIEVLTDRVMNWYGFTYTWDYALRPYAMLVAIEIHKRGITTDRLYGTDIEEADKATGGKIRAMFEALQPTPRGDKV